MTLWLALVLAGIATLSVASAWRSHRELRAWLGRDELAARRSLRVLLLVSASLLIALAWMRLAQTPARFTGAGSDVVLLMDVSRSMDTRDTPPSRLRRATRVAERLVQHASGTRIALVLFAGDAFPAVPLTHDRDALETYLHTLDSQLISRPGSDLARALRVAADVFDPRSDRSRALVLLSDGEHAGGDLDAALSHVRRLGVRVVTVGFGTPDGDVVPASGGDPLEDARGETVRSRRADALLERIAQGTDGVYLREREDDPQPRDLLPPARAPARKPALKSVRSDGLLLLAAVLLGTEILLSTRRRKRSSCGHLRGAALAVLGGLGLSCGSGDWITAGDRLLEAQEARKALSMYRKAERKAGAGPLTSIRIGNAHYRLDEDRRSAGAYLEALRGVDAEDHSARFVASFNLGNTFLRRSLYAEARDAFWAALRERPENLAAKFNYEWAYERAQTEAVPPSPSGSARPPESRAQSHSPSGSPAPDATAREPAEARRAGLEPAEAQRWLESLEETLAEPLRREIERSLPPGGRGPRQGQTW